MFAVMESMFAEVPDSEKYLLEQKIYYPYTYMSQKKWPNNNCGLLKSRKTRSKTEN